MQVALLDHTPLRREEGLAGGCAQVTGVSCTSRTSFGVAPGRPVSTRRVCSPSCGEPRGLALWVLPKSLLVVRDSGVRSSSSCVSDLVRFGLEGVSRAALM